MKRAAHIKMTEREFRAWKRREWRAVERALRLFNRASAYTPAWRSLIRLEREVRAIRAELDTPNWRTAPERPS